MAEITKIHTPEQTAEEARALSDQAESFATNLDSYASALEAASHTAQTGHGDFFITGLTVFILACFVGYYVVWKVTPALHSPLMGVTNAISSVIIVGALIAAGPALFSVSKVFGFLAIMLASVNIFGGFIVTKRMLDMFHQKKKA